ncbi:MULTISPECIES: HEAT repeat domain-containing protein [Haloarcula]|uniref:HEAT repeat domain-containing protein n=1 Tax=Haloarcula TaxID=2237 RepID=UPI0007BB7A13|nr:MULTISPECIES: HEAT repeat domain-containing protein [Haloarcula]KAA9406681.1 HEAT repeat domain-containing protein [Haloarcula sp. CBA1131]KZX49132.1 phycocyanobilin lyase [Haloarcula sp. K1]MUV50459.1 HEAT repeat domain-containing protein [Haloarcula sp. CBA1122]
MSNGDDEADASDDAEAADEIDVTAEELESRLTEASEDLDAAETEADLDDVESSLDDIENDLEAADLPEPDEDDDAEDPREELESQLSDLRDDLDAQRGPYAEDVVTIVSDAEDTVTDSEWTDDGEGEAQEAVETFLDESAEFVDHDADTGGDFVAAGDALTTVVDAIEAANLDPDEDTETIEGLLEAAETLETGLDEAEVWDDLTVQEQLDARGFYDILTNENRKDFPPEWNAAKLHAEEGDFEQVLFAYDKLGSEFFDGYIVDLLYNLGSDAEPAFDAMHQRAQKRDKGPIEVLGKIGDERATETLHDYIDGDGDPALQKVTLRALGAIGSAESVQPVANRLDADSEEIRSVAARTLGLLGDTRAIEPLGDILESDDSDSVRASAAWALRQIGTETALEEAARYTDDRAYIVQAEAEKASSA